MGCNGIYRVLHTASSMSNPIANALVDRRERVYRLGFRRSMRMREHGGSHLLNRQHLLDLRQRSQTGPYHYHSRHCCPLLLLPWPARQLTSGHGTRSRCQCICTLFHAPSLSSQCRLKNWLFSQLAYSIVGFHGTGIISYQEAMAAVFLEGCVPSQTQLRLAIPELTRSQMDLHDTELARRPPMARPNHSPVSRPCYRFRNRSLYRLRRFVPQWSWRHWW